MSNKPKRYRTYMFRDQDPMAAEVLSAIGKEFGEVSKASDVAHTTFRKLEDQEDQASAACHHSKTQVAISANAGSYFNM